MHVESTMMIPEQLSRAVLPWGTTTICTDPHEIGNVMGIEGVEFMLETRRSLLCASLMLRCLSLAMSRPGLESSGASFEAPEIRTLLEKEGVIGIAEIMDFVGVYKDSPRMHAIIDEGLKKNAFLQATPPLSQAGSCAPTAWEVRKAITKARARRKCGRSSAWACM